MARKYNLEEVQVEELSTNIDPTKNGAYTDWICREFKSGQLDTHTAKETLTQFDRQKQSPKWTGSKNIFA